MARKSRQSKKHLAQERQQEFHQAGEELIDPEKEETEQHCHDSHHDGGRHGLLAGRPDDFRRLCLDLPDELTG